MPPRAAAAMYEHTQQQRITKLRCADGDEGSVHKLHHQRSQGMFDKHATRHVTVRERNRYDISCGSTRRVRTHPCATRSRKTENMKISSSYQLSRGHRLHSSASSKVAVAIIQQRVERRSTSKSPCIILPSRVWLSCK